MTRRSTVLGALLLAGCATLPDTPPQTAVDRIRVASATAILPLDPARPAELAALVDGTARRGVAATYVVVAPPEAAAAVLAAIGELPAAQRPSVKLEVASGARLRVEVTTLQASAPACPNWSRRSDDDFSNLPSSNFGCADAANLAAQVDDPRDLVAGRGRRTTTAAPLGAAVARLAADRVKPLKAADRPASGGPIADDPVP